MNTYDKTNTIGWNLQNTFQDLPDSLYTPMKPASVKAPKVLILNTQLEEALGLQVATVTSEELAQLFSGNIVPETAAPLSQAYAGHQFGYLNMLGDGRAILIGEQITPKGEVVDVQLKGSGPTPYSRRGDGRAAVGPMLREYLISEAMYALGIPTTRSLAVVGTGEKIFREKPLDGAVLTRIAASHLRVGTFQYATSQGVDVLKALADYTIDRHYPSVKDANNPYLELLNEVVRRQAELISKWQLVGFIHGVMNTDNMTLSGETIDYGPCAFMDTYHPDTVFSSIDANGRYAYSKQPGIGVWNLSRFAESLLPLLSDDMQEAVKLATKAVEGFSKHFQEAWLSGLLRKLGLVGASLEDAPIVLELLQLMEKHKADYTNTFVFLTLQMDENGSIDSSVLLNDSFLLSKDFMDWQDSWKTTLERLACTKRESFELMKSYNPFVIPRNHLVESALKAATGGDLSEFKALLNVLSSPYAYDVQSLDFAKLPPTGGGSYQTFCGT
ncbi:MULTISPECIES: YdiU family protein [unclassified Fusibacter]|uniref:protein adenylyltransferase SelO n=1 Tax=unclassified Fusibacter TaxID=2624464 RepID=UPI00101234B3|nr:MULTISPECIES: YdiU family protein [unclassified Fusibacter]MCK8060205.1 YdiU family protein [Fusibacter sp. A2]NPE22345.1 YdiU family protein [Fusibacter sp. A1]RXV61118.1 YdiU family protein [Fusibacter sp. A1]